jgi:hypothetical protein
VLLLHFFIQKNTFVFRHSIGIFFMNDEQGYRKMNYGNKHTSCLTYALSPPNGCREMNQKWITLC